MQQGNSARVAQDVRLTLGNRIRALRHLRGLSQEDLAERAGLHRTYLSGIERGSRNPALLNMARLAAALSVPLKDLFEESEN